MSRQEVWCMIGLPEVIFANKPVAEGDSGCEMEAKKVSSLWCHPLSALRPENDYLPPILIHLINISVTNTSVNPARSTGVALFAGGWAINQLWLFWVAPIVGSILGAIVYRFIGSKSWLAEKTYLFSPQSLVSRKAHCWQRIPAVIFLFSSSSLNFKLTGLVCGKFDVDISRLSTTQLQKKC